MKVIKIPVENGLGRTKGTSKAPEIMLNYFPEIKSEEIDVDNGNILEQQEKIIKGSLKIFSENKKVLFVGGDHSLTYSTTKSFLKYYKNPALIIFDAHADCMHPLPEPTHEEFLRALIEIGFPKENILLMGVRELDPSEKKFIKDNKIRIISVEQIDENIKKTINEIISFSKDKNIYLSIDIDVLSAEEASATGYPVPNGLTKEQLLLILSEINKIPNLKSIDLVEINPTIGNSQETIDIGRDIIKLLS